MQLTQPPILIVDDSVIITERFKQMIAEEGITNDIIYANSYRSALLNLQYFKPDLIFIDISLPDGSGVDILKWTKTNCPRTKSVMITNHADEYYKDLCLTLGADSFLDKSLEFDQIPEYIFRHISSEIS